MSIQLIPVSQNKISGKIVDTVNTRKLHQFLGSKKDFTSWIKSRIKQYEFIENQDFIVSTRLGENPKGGRPSKDYVVTLNIAKELSMVERTEKGRKARRYFIECERKVLDQFSRSLGQGQQTIALKEDVSQRPDYFQGLDAQQMQYMQDFAQELQLGKTPVTHFPPVLNCDIVSTHYLDHTLTLYRINQQAYVPLVQLTRILDMDFRSQRQHIRTKTDHQLFENKTKTCKKLLCLTISDACEWLGNITTTNLKMAKRNYAMKAQCALPYVLKEAAKNLHSLQDIPAVAPPAPLKLAAPKVSKVPKAQSEAQLIKALEKLKGEKITVLTHGTIKKALTSYQQLDDYLLKLNKVSATFLTELLGKHA